MTGFALEADTRLALDVALGAAGAMGDERCGTEHLLFGVVATASGEMAELTELFALDRMRVERAVFRLRDHLCNTSLDTPEPKLSTRAEIALASRSSSGAPAINGFDLLCAVIDDPRSGAATALRILGVRVGELRRLAELGAARLDRTEIEGLIAALDRRGEDHRPWWGPTADGSVVSVPLADGFDRIIGRSDSAVATLDGLVAGADGFGLTITVSSRERWLLPPRWELEEELIPGIGALHRRAPDVVTIDLRFGDGRVISSSEPSTRWRPDRPDDGTLVRLGSRTVVDDRNDRRLPARRSDTVEWWVWPLPQHDGPVELIFEWPAEALTGVIELDGAQIRRRAARLRVADIV